MVVIWWSYGSHIGAKSPYITLVLILGGVIFAYVITLFAYKSDHVLNFSFLTKVHFRAEFCDHPRNLALTQLLSKNGNLGLPLYMGNLPM